MVIWLTGLSGSGKTTIASEICKTLVSKNKKAFVIDGDLIRMGLCSDLGFSVKDRTENIRRIAHLSKIMSDAGLIVIVSTISPLNKDRLFARSLFSKNKFFEIYIHASIKTCIARDPKGLYKKALNNEIVNFTGINQIYEIPTNSNLILYTEKYSPSECANEVIKSIILKDLVLNF